MVRASIFSNTETGLRQGFPAGVAGGQRADLLVLRPAPGQGSSGAGVDAGWGQPGFNARKTPVAFLHLLPGTLVAGRPEGGRSVGTGHGAGVAADAVGIVKAGQARGDILGQAAHRAGRDTGSIGAVETGDGQIDVFAAALVLADLPVGLLAGLGVQIVLIHTGDGAGSTGGTLFLVEIKQNLHGFAPFSPPNSGRCGSRGIRNRDRCGPEG